MVVPHVYYMHQALYCIRQLHIHPPFGNAGDDAFIYISETLLHIFHFFKLYCLPLRFISPPLHLTGVLCCLRKNRLIMPDLLFIHPSPQIILDDPVDLQIRIPADWGRKMSIIISRQSEMPGIFRRISGLLHRTEGQSRDQWFLRTSLYFCQQLLDLLWPHLACAKMHRMAKIIDKGCQSPDLLIIRSFMGPV